VDSRVVFQWTNDDKSWKWLTALCTWKLELGIASEIYWYKIFGKWSVKETSKQSHTQHNEVTLAWGLLRLAPIMYFQCNYTHWIGQKTTTVQTIHWQIFLITSWNLILELHSLLTTNLIMIIYLHLAYPLTNKVIRGEYVIVPDLNGKDRGKTLLRLCQAVEVLLVRKETMNTSNRRQHWERTQ